MTLAQAPLLASAGAAHAQAWVPPAGVGSVTVAVQNLEYTGHFVTDGTFFEVGMSEHNLIDIEADYAITDRLSVAATIPFVFAKYLDAYAEAIAAGRSPPFHREEVGPNDALAHWARGDA